MLMLNLSAYEHSGRLLPHHHTHKPSLVLLLGLTCLLLAGVGTQSKAATQADASLRVTAEGPVPNQPAVIVQPSDGSKISKSAVDLHGTCQPGFLVKITRGSQLGGTLICNSYGSFVITTALNLGTNIISARSYNLANQPGPQSPPITLTVPAATSTLASNIPVSLRVDQMYSSAFVNKPAAWNLAVGGGSAPYALSIDWSDGNPQVVSLASSGTIQLIHKYSQRGRYPISISITDSLGQTSYLRLINLITPEPLAAAQPADHISGSLSIAWPLYLLGIIIFLSFWLGERFVTRFDRQAATA